MRTRMIVAALFVASVAGAQAAQVPGTNAVQTPKVKGGGTKAEFRIGAIAVQAERSYDFGGSVTTGAGQIKGVEVLMRASGIGVYARSLSGSFGSGGATKDVISADARLLLFPPVFTIFGGVGKRALDGLKLKIYDVAMAGISSTAQIGGTGMRTYMSGAVILAPDKSTGSAKADPSTGLEGEAAIFYRFPKAPLFFTVGYRTEVFTGKTKSGTTTIEAPEEVRGLRVGGGIQFGGH